MIKHREINTNEDGEGWGDVGHVASWVKDSTGTKRCPSTEGLQSWLVQGPYLQSLLQAMATIGKAFARLFSGGGTLDS